jgi:hypothetical protein
MFRTHVLYEKSTGTICQRYEPSPSILLAPLRDFFDQQAPVEQLQEVGFDDDQAVSYNILRREPVVYEFLMKLDDLAGTDVWRRRSGQRNGSGSLGNDEIAALP